MSVRRSASLPSTCSGAMYGRVPRIVPSCVRLSALPVTVARAESSDSGVTVSIAFASPKSSSLTPDLRQHHVRGLQVSMNDSLPMRLLQGVRDFDAVAQRLLERQRAAGQSIRQRLALEVLHDEVLGLAFPSHVIERADVRVREPRDGLCLPLETLSHLRRREMLRQHLDRHLPPEPRVPRLVDLAHPSRTERREDLVVAETGARGKRHEVDEILSVGGLPHRASVQRVPEFRGLCAP